MKNRLSRALNGRLFMSLDRHALRRFRQGNSQVGLDQPQMDPRVIQIGLLFGLGLIGQTGGEGDGLFEVLEGVVDCVVVGDARFEGEDWGWIGDKLFHGVFSYCRMGAPHVCCQTGGWQLCAG